jgi:anti-sigma B factor antagonist
VTRFSEEDGIVVIRPERERIDAAAAPAFKAELQENVAPGARRVLVDLSAVKFVDSTGLGVFVSLLKMMGKDGMLAITGSQPAVRRLFQLTGMDRVFRFLDTEEDARAALGA